MVEFVKETLLVNFRIVSPQQQDLGVHPANFLVKSLNICCLRNQILSIFEESEMSDFGAVRLSCKEVYQP